MILLFSCTKDDGPDNGGDPGFSAVPVIKMAEYGDNYCRQQKLNLHDV